MRSEQNHILVNQQGKSYRIDSVNDYLISRLQSYSSLALVCDANTKIYATEILELVPQAFIEEIPVGERSKSFQQLELSCERLSGKLHRDSAVVAVGGGVVGDFAGFLSSILLRGLDLYMVPTSLLAMVDSSIGGKTAINLRNGKNLVGSFVTPNGIWIHLESLRTLPREHYYSGFGEMVKHAILDSSDLLQKTLAGFDEYDKLIDLIFESIRIKKSIVEQDFRESGLRKCLNLGHTVGHALEMVYGFKRAHGICVLEGLLIEHRIAQKLGYLDGKWLGDVEQLWSHIGFSNFQGNPAELHPFLLKDKKNKLGTIDFSFCTQPGQLAWFDQQPIISLAAEQFFELLEGVL